MLKKLNMLKIDGEQLSARPSGGSKFMNNLGSKAPIMTSLEEMSPIKRFGRVYEYNINEKMNLLDEPMQDMDVKQPLRQRTQSFNHQGSNLKHVQLD